MSTPTVESLQQELKELTKTVNELKMGSAPKKPKKERKPSAFNLFMKERIPLVKAENPELKHNDAFKIAAGQWKDRAITDDTA